MNEKTHTAKPEQKWFELVSRLSAENVASGKGGPFAAAVIKNNKLIASACNEVLGSGDPTAHAEVSVIRKACRELGSFQLDDCILISSCEPCPMCLGAIYWARPAAVYYINSRQDAAEIGFDDQFIYDEISREHHQRRIPFLKEDFPAARQAFLDWKNKSDKTPY
jgi:tRNA(Arg) A34 adenosine deaminase TadA